MPRGDHRFPFSFQLPEYALPCSFESKIGTIRYYLRVIIDIPYASPPQGLKYFSVIGPHIDCMEDRYLIPVRCEEQSRRCCLCCLVGPVGLDATLQRSAYCCGEHIKLQVEIQNGSDQNVWVVIRLLQYVEFHIKTGVLGLSKGASHRIWEFRGPPVPPHTTKNFQDLQQHLIVPVTPPSLEDVCKLMEIYYVVKVSLGLEKSGEDLSVDFPIDIATVPYRIPNKPSPQVSYEVADSRVEGGSYISPEFQIGQVYDGSMLDTDENIILYRPVYPVVQPESPCMPPQTMPNSENGQSNELNLKAQQPNVLKIRDDRDRPVQLRRLSKAGGLKGDETTEVSCLLAPTERDTHGIKLSSPSEGLKSDFSKNDENDADNVSLLSSTTSAEHGALTRTISSEHGVTRAMISAKPNNGIPHTDKNLQTSSKHSETVVTSQVESMMDRRTDVEPSLMQSSKIPTNSIDKLNEPSKLDTDTPQLDKTPNQHSQESAHTLTKICTSSAPLASVHHSKNSQKSSVEQSQHKQSKSTSATMSVKTYLAKS